MANRRFTFAPCLSLLFAGLTLACPARASHETQAATTRIAHGEAVNTCGFTPILVGPRECTATLVHPKLIICAAHCITPMTRSISFGEHSKKPGKRIQIDYCKKHPGHPSDNGKDWSFCVLKEEVKDVPVIPPAFGCELEEYLKVGQEVTQVGYGASAGKHGASRGTGKKRWAKSKITQMAFQHADNIKVGPTPDNVVACPGDSGGPLLVRTKDGSWRSIAIASKYSGNCGAENPFNIYARIGKAVAWIESESKIDITPCFDSDGTWNPTKECGGFYAGDASKQGSWDNWCEDAPKSGYSSTCGEPFEKTDSPKIELESPKNDTVFESKKLPALVPIKAKLSGDKPIAISIGLVIDGKELETTALDKKPWSWKQELDEGEHTVALWYDINKLTRQQSDSIKITVGKASTDSSKKDPDQADDEEPENEESSPDGDNEETGEPSFSTPEDNEFESDEPDDEEGSKDNAAKKPPASLGAKKLACNISDTSGQWPFTLLLFGLFAWNRRRH